MVILVNDRKINRGGKWDKYKNINSNGSFYIKLNDGTGVKSENIRPPRKNKIRKKLPLSHRNEEERSEVATLGAPGLTGPA